MVDDRSGRKRSGGMGRDAEKRRGGGNSLTQYYTRIMPLDYYYLFIIFFFNYYRYVQRIARKIRQKIIMSRKCFEKTNDKKKKNVLKNRYLYTLRR